MQKVRLDYNIRPLKDTFFVNFSIQRVFNLKTILKMSHRGRESDEEKSEK